MQQKHRVSWCVRTSITAAERSIVVDHDALGSKETGPLHLGNQKHRWLPSQLSSASKPPRCQQFSLVYACSH